MYCSKCGKEAVNPGEYCAYCGAPLKRTPEPGQPLEGPEEGRTEPGMEEEPGQGGAEREKEEKPEGGGPGVPAAGFKIAALVLAALYVISILSDIPGVFGSLFTVLGGYPVYGILYLLSAALLVIAHAVMAAALALFGLCRDDQRGNTESLLLAVISAGILHMAAAVVSPVIGGIAVYFRFHAFYYDIGAVGLSLLGTVIAVGILAGLTFLAGMKPFAGKTREELMDEAKTLPDVLSEEIERFRSEHQKGQSAAGNMAGNMTGNTAENAAGGSAAGRPAPNAQPGPRRMKENRGLLKYILIGAVTCGVYMLYTLHMLAKDTNEMCDGDGETTAGLLKLIVFTLITCTVYNYIWHYKLMNRIQNNAERYGVKVKTVGSMDLGACWVVLSLVGLLISWCGIGLILSLYADYLMFQNMNLLSKAYNAAVVDTYQA